MDRSITVKPVLWRVMVWRGVPIIVGSAVGISIGALIFDNSFPSMAKAFPLIVGTAIGVLIGIVLLRKKLNVVVHDGNISGPAGQLIRRRATFPIANVDVSRLRQPSLYEKISLIRTIRSRDGQKIVMIDSVYEDSAIDRLYNILERGDSTDLT